MVEKQIDGTGNLLLDDAILCLTFGFFEGAVRRCERAVKLAPELEKTRDLVKWLASVYAAGHYHTKVLVEFPRPQDLVRSLAGGQGMAELIWLLSDVKSPAAVRVNQLQAMLVDTMGKQNGVLVAHHPTAVLALAERAAREGKDRTIAHQFVNCALGWQSPYVAVGDTERLARSLVALRAPLAFWVDWAAIYIRHLLFSALRARNIETWIRGNDGTAWALAQEQECESVLKRVLAIAPSELFEVIIRLAPHFEADEFAHVIRTRFQPNNEPFAFGEVDPRWYDVGSLRSRYFWHDMISEREQRLARNGDWACFCIPSPDYSMAAAQWWRLLESVLKRVVVNELSTLFSAHPEWVAQDRQNLSESLRKKEAVFVDTLSDPASAKKMPLAEILFVLEKCVVSPRAYSPKGSKLRFEATLFLQRYGEQFGPMVSANLLNPHRLTRKNINWFRNRASHDDEMDVIDASLGRLISKQIISKFYLPCLVGEGFHPSL